ncbi:RNA 2',3'-cyclic phosphodiesterase [Halonotius terrestris]|uniref:RNA 2',3'-cyclic phosphodiesterase n=1 Tax=Halonotius terrestris TaxID=2487750 RepID=A0A8J8PA66_9EURY|nr:RNA 2',3'-cyclic phosphodiesterase [Halonotius terrestris]TQQ81361.1 RNA 2',3'-cyclic phosphodiesterase [Halonotius terrestris]
MRLFVSVDLPPSLADAVADVQAPLADCAGLRLTHPTQAHFTLKFLGDTDPDRVAEIEAALETAVADAGIDPFDCTVGGLGVFPSLEYISVVWVGVRDGDAALTAVADAVEAELTDIGFESEDHEFTPHVTLARMDDTRGKSTVQDLVAGTDPTVGTFHVDAIRLTESTLTDDGPAYETVSEIEL